MDAEETEAKMAEQEAEENYRERQLKLEMERQRLMRDSQMIEEVRNNIIFN
jgi:hypothetical protein